MFAKKTVKDIDVRGKRCLVRVDFNVPLSEGAVTDDTRVRAALPTIRYLIDHGARVILMSHLGRPKGAPDPQYSLRPVRRVLQRLLGRNVVFVDDIVGPEAQEAVARMVDGEVLMLENVRFHPGEKANDPEFAEALASLADIFVNDAFGAAHRAHASTAGVAQYLPAVAGLLLAREVDTLTSMLAEPERPFVAILGGSKVSDKIGVIDRLLECVDVLLIGGGMCFTFLVAKGVDVGESIVEQDWVERAGEMLKKASERGVDLMLPVDFVIADQIVEDAETKIVGREEIPEGMMGLDIGPTTGELYKGAIATARTIFWNGPMGVFELTPFETGTREVATAVARNNRAASIVGGGDSVAALKKFDLEERVTFVSTGGGAAMKLLEGTPLPGVETLLDKDA
ncbi:phosphoglycerate kinase [Coriobacteriia bacterium Es71-Z0120]|uniref:phosphoglycerate kinase n=1 Tax=Parvivirga hydrogeniphila TaxID=2939460 RepID=UPI002260D2F6|nr:phosphoglycerate kinase [Parvivirga hydrogeniphila]MCL4078877.1 phosphoglycerate kinase [Parvivirga hydrogeniphila]